MFSKGTVSLLGYLKKSFKSSLVSSLILTRAAFSFLVLKASSVKTEILATLGVNTALKYLGVPLITTMCKAEDCRPLVDRITRKIQSWTSRFLSYPIVAESSLLRLFFSQFRFIGPLFSCSLRKLLMRFNN